MFVFLNNVNLLLFKCLCSKELINKIKYNHLKCIGLHNLAYSTTLAVGAEIIEQVLNARRAEAKQVEAKYIEMLNEKGVSAI